MRISIIAVGKKIPSWAQAGVNEYLKRLQREYELTVVEIANSLPEQHPIRI
ncbi:MAG: 23S rRNA (pseudouridine(1915)-N(3))-methyltransferase RlmH [Pseudohongiellaceae bacterium]